MSQTPDRKEGVINDSLRAAPYQRKRGVGLTATLATAEYFPEAFDILVREIKRKYLHILHIWDGAWY
jgi:hypothetical protein